MNWLNIEIRILTSKEFLGSSPTERATWICLLRYSAQQENGGKIKGCRDWNDRTWMQLAGITSEEVLTESELWHWIDNDITVWEYPTCKEKEIKAKRKAGRTTGKKNSQSSALNSVSNSVSNSAIEKRREGKEKGKEGERERKESFEECWKLFGKYGNKQKALRYWNRLNESDCITVKNRIPIYLKYLNDTGISQKMFDGWINPENRIWETTYENIKFKDKLPEQLKDTSFMIADDEEL